MFYKSKKIRTTILLISVAFNILFFVSLLYITCVKTDMFERLIAKTGLISYDSSESRHQIEFRCLEGWANSLGKQLKPFDIVFYGNSITFESDFQSLFPNLKICNLGCNRDGLDDLVHRSFIIRSAKPSKIFILGGINNIIDISLEEFEAKYTIMVDTIIKQNPSSHIYLQSLLPVNIEMGIGSRYLGCQEKIKKANKIIKTISHTRDCHFVDLYSIYQVNDLLPRKYTRDGLHLYPQAYEIWAQAIAPYLLEGTM